MYKKVIEYKDFDGNKRIEDAYFNFTETELRKLNITTKGGISAYAERIVHEQNGDELIKIFDTLILGAYGRKSDDGRNFVKSQEIRDDFASTLAYDQLFHELSTDAKAFAEFFNNVIPSENKLSAEQLNSAIAQAESQINNA